jgi:DNA-binding beta-propeller fold protein YncE
MDGSEGEDRAVSAAIFRSTRPATWRARLALLSFALLSVFLVSVGSAVAAGTEGHVGRERVFSFEFGGQGSADGEFDHPAGVAVDDATGGVYVADRENGRVEEFAPVAGTEGQPTGVTYTGSFPPTAFPSQIAVDNCTKDSAPCSTAEDPSAGDVYVAAAKNAKAAPSEDELLYKFTATGTEVGTPHKFKSAIDGLAVGPAGALYVYEVGVEGATVDIFPSTELNLEAKKPEDTVKVDLKGGAEPGLAVDAEGNIYVGAGLAAGNVLGDEGVESLVSELAAEYGFLHGGSQPIVAELNGAGAVLIPALDYEPTTAVAEAPATEAGGEDEALITNVANAGGEQVSSLDVLSTEVAGAEPRKRLIQHLLTPGLKEADGVAVDPTTGAAYVAGAASDTVDVFDLEPRGHPSVGDLSAQTECRQDGAELCSPSETVTLLRAQINSAGVDTHYDFEYGTGSGTCRANPSSCTTVPAPAADAGDEFGGSKVSAELPDLPPGQYHYRVIASAGGEIVRSSEQAFTVVSSASGLLDGRAWEMVSPPKKGGAEPESLTREGGTIQAAVEGNAITYVADGPIPAGAEPEGNRNPEPTQVISTRRPEGGWETQDITTANGTGAGVGPGKPREYQFFSRNLAIALAAPFPSTDGPYVMPPLSPLLPGELAGTQETSVYLGDEPPVQPEPADKEETRIYDQAQANGMVMGPPNRGFLALVTQANQPQESGVTEREHFGREVTGEGIVAEGATPDLSHIVVQSFKAASGLYEWNGAEGETKLKLVSELPEGKRVEAKNAGLGGVEIEGSADDRHAISDNGALVFWTFKDGADLHLYMRDTETQKTVELDEPQSGAPPASESDTPFAVFQTATDNGKQVFFTDTQRLTSDARAVNGSPNLYVYEPEAEGNKLTDLTPQEGADVLVSKFGGGVLGVSEEENSETGTYVYFVANGALTPNAMRGQCGPTETKATRPGENRPLGATCNLYVMHYDAEKQEWEKPKLVAVLSSEDNPDWGGATETGNLSHLTSRVSPDGEYLAFMSDRSLTGYDNEDIGEKHPGERLDEEVFLYDAKTGHLVCASCNPTGTRPRGVLDLGQDNGGGTGEGLGLVVDRSENWAVLAGEQTDNWLAGSIPGWTALGKGIGLYQSRYLSNSGRLFFDSADPLVPVAVPTREEAVGGEKLTVGVENVYEYEPGGVGQCGSEGGCVGLVSSGASKHESAFLDASESGNDVFFLTAAQLVSQDQDTNFDIYDARVCGGTCPTTQETPPVTCEGEGCLKTFVPPAALSAPGSAAQSGSGNLLAQVGVLGKKEEKAVAPTTKKPLTRAQKLAAALKACKKDKKKSKRVACERQARKKYGPIKRKSAAKKSSSEEKTS